MTQMRKLSLIYFCNVHLSENCANIKKTGTAEIDKNLEALLNSNPYACSQPKPDW